MNKYVFSPQTALQEFCNIKSLNDSQATTILRKLQNLIRIFNPTADLDTDFLLRNKFENALPSHIRALIMCKDFKDLIDMARFCDEIIKLHNTTEEHLFSATQNNSHATNTDTRKFGANDNFCYYHRRFGCLARKCQNLCAWKQQPLLNEREKQ